MRNKDKFCGFCGGRVLNKGKIWSGFYNTDTGEKLLYELIECEHYPTSVIKSLWKGLTHTSNRV